MPVARRITTLRLGQNVRYLDKEYTVIDLYPHIAYLRTVDEDGKFSTICVCLGDLVMAGIEPSMIDIGRSRPEKAS